MVSVSWRVRNSSEVLGAAVRLAAGNPRYFTNRAPTYSFLRQDEGVRGDLDEAVRLGVLTTLTFETPAVLGCRGPAAQLKEACDMSTHRAYAVLLLSIGAPR